ncbi:MAG: ATP-dependent zinc protease [Planctomycetaceae bacterium]|nr:ATP-dependent zinc protease [Planctomycetaceae bacterium]
MTARRRIVPAEATPQDRRRGVLHDGERPSQALVGWREWVRLPALGEFSIKAKIDTGARSSSLHAFEVETFRRRGILHVRFQVHPRQRSVKKSIQAEARVLEFRAVRSSSGHLTMRPVIRTDLELFGQKWPIELTLANRDEMGFRMLLGREALRRRLIVDSGRSYLAGRPQK